MNNKTIKPLEQEYTHNGFLYELFKREEDAALYRVSRRPAKTDAEPIVWWEVHIVQRRKAYWDNEKDFDLVEYTSKDADFGYKAWCFRDREQADFKFNALLKNE